MHIDTHPHHALRAHVLKITRKQDFAGKHNRRCGNDIRPHDADVRNPARLCPPYPITPTGTTSGVRSRVVSGSKVKVIVEDGAPEKARETTARLPHVSHVLSPEPVSVQKILHGADVAADAAARGMLCQASANS